MTDPPTHSPMDRWVSENQISAVTKPILRLFSLFEIYNIHAFAPFRNLKKRHYFEIFRLIIANIYC